MTTDKSECCGADDSLSYDAIHYHMRKRIQKPDKCSVCGEEKKWLELSNIDHKYELDPTKWRWVCRRCHMIHDDRLEKFLEHSKKRRLPNIACEWCGRVFRPKDLETRACSWDCWLSIRRHKPVKEEPC